jgi:ABC-type transport system involved in multi-copper enzyme maturation permease subunit
MSIPTPTVEVGRSQASHAPLGTMPGSWTQAFLMSRYQFRDYLRSRRFILMMAIVAVIGGLLITVIGHYRPAGLIGSSNAFFGTLWTGGVEVLIVFAGIIFGGDAIAGEFQNKTGYFLMGLPIKRWSVYAGKYIAAFAASLVTILVYLVILVAFGSVYFGTGAASVALFESLLLAILYLAALLGTTFLFSSLFKTSLYAVLVVAVLFLFGFSLIDALIEGLVNIEPWFIVTYANAVISYPFSGVPIHIGRLGGMTTYAPTYIEGIAIMLGYFVLTAAAGLLLFEREEFT